MKKEQITLEKLQEIIVEYAKENRAQKEEIATYKKKIAQQQSEINVLKEKIDYLLRQQFTSKSERGQVITTTHPLLLFITWSYSCDPIAASYAMRWSV